MKRPLLLALIALAVLAAIHYSTVPKTIWEYDENLFALGVEDYQPLVHHPPPPGLPVFIGAAKLVALFAGGDPFRALVALSVITLAAGLVSWFLAFREMSGSVLTATLGTAVLYLSPALLVSGVLPQSDSGALALLGLAAYFGAKKDARLTALACAACVGWRQQFAIAVVPMFFVSLVFLKEWRARTVALTTFTFGCLLWLVPLIGATGGPEDFVRWLFGQASYYASHDADLSRNAYTPSLLAFRFVAHPWGPKWLSLPMLAIAAVGAVLAVKRRITPAIPLLVGSFIYLGFALTTMDPADAVRYAIPSLPAIAFLVAIALPSRDLIGVGVAGAYAAGSIMYTAPVLKERSTTASPPVLAARWIRAHVPANALILYDLPLRPHTEFLLREYKSMRVDAGLLKYGGDPTMPMVIFADGARGNAQGITFSWPDTDAYRKLTRQHYGAVSVLPLPPRTRYRALSGVEAPERTREGEAWRWIGSRAVLELPDLGASNVRLRFHAPRDYPLAENRIHILVHGHEVTTTIKKNADAEVLVPIPRGTVRVEIIPEQSFVPAKLPGSGNRDPRTLSIMLTAVEQQ